MSANQFQTQGEQDGACGFASILKEAFELLIEEVTREKLDGLDAYKTTIDTQMTDGSLGVTSQSVPSFYSFTKQSGSDLRATMALYNGDRQWLIDNLQLQNYASLSGKHTRA